MNVKPKRKKAPVVIGGIFGLLLWCWDYDFFLNAGGPSTRVSDAILRILHLQGAEYPVPVLLPLLILVVAGAVIGVFAANALQRPDSTQQTVQSGTRKNG